MKTKLFLNFKFIFNLKENKVFSDEERDDCNNSNNETRNKLRCLNLEVDDNSLIGHSQW